MMKLLLFVYVEKQRSPYKIMQYISVIGAFEPINALSIFKDDISSSHTFEKQYSKNCIRYLPNFIQVYTLLNLKHW